MPVRAYLSPWESITDADGMTTYYARIGLPSEYLHTNQINHSMMDLRVAEQQGQIPAQGWALVLCNVTPPQHNQIIKVADTHEVDAGTTVAEVRAIIGDEATEDIIDGSNIEQLRQYFVSCHRGRINRWKGR